MPNVIISPTGVQGPRGNAVLNGTGAPSSGTGIDGDYYVDTTGYPTSAILYGPKAGGAWPGSGITFGGGAIGALLAANNLSDVQNTAAARTNLGLGTAATQASSAFDTAGAAAAAQAAAATDATSKANAAQTAAISAAATDATTKANTATTAAEADAATKYIALQPWVFDITAAAYGAVGDAQIVTDGAVTAGVATLTCSTSTPFTSNLVGKSVLIQGAGLAGVTAFATTFTTYNSPGSMGLAATPPTSITGAIVVFGTNNYTAIRAANTAAEQYLAAGHPYSEVYTPPTGGFILDGPLDTSKSGNGQVPIGAYPTTGDKKTPHFRSDGSGAGVRHWQQLVPQISGGTWISFGFYPSVSAQLSDLNANGNPGIISGPNEGTANGPAYGANALFSNVMPMISNMAFLVPHTQDGITHGAWNFYGCANAHIRNVSVSTLGVVPSPTDYTSPGVFGSGLSIAALMPAPGNNDLSIVENLSVQGGFTYGLFFSEHTLITRGMILYCWAGLCPVGSYAGSVGAVHEMRVLSASVEDCTHEVYIVGPGSQGVGPTVDIHLSTESGTPNIAGSSTGALMSALGPLKLTGLFDIAAVTTESPTGIEIINGQVPRAVSRKTGAFTCSPIDRTLICDTSGGAFTATLPDATVNPVEYTLRNVGGNALTVAAVNSELITAVGSTAGAATVTVAAGQSLRVQANYNGTAWGWYAL